MTAATTILLGCVLRVTLFAVAAALFYLLVRRLRAGAGASAAMASLGMVLALTLLAASPWPRWDFSPSEAARAASTAPAQASAPQEANASVVPSPALAEPVAKDSPWAAGWEAFREALASPAAAPEADAPASQAWDWRRGVWVVLALSLALGAGRFAWGLWSVAGLVNRSKPIGEEASAAAAVLAELSEKLALPQKVLLRESSDVVTPATVGWRRPLILLPAAAWRDWSEEEMRAVLSHELAHVAARDYASWLVARLAVAAHFYHPLVHWLAGRLQLEQELAADAAAVRLVGDRQRYLQTLAALAMATPNHRLAGPARTLIPGRSLLMRRVEMLRTTKTPGPAGAHRWLVATSWGLLAALAVGLAGVRQEAIGQEEAGQEEVTPAAATLAAEPVERIDLSVVPPDSFYVLSLRPAELLSKEAYRPLIKPFDDLASGFLIAPGVSVTDYEEVMLIGSVLSVDRPRVVVRFTNPAVPEAIIRHITEVEGGVKEFSVEGLQAWETHTARIVRLDSRTLVGDSKPRVGSGSEFAPSPVKIQPIAHPPWAASWEGLTDRPVVAAVNPKLLDNLLASNELPGGLPSDLVAPAIKHVEWTVASLDLTAGVALQAVAQCDGAEGAKKSARTARAMLTLMSNVYEEQRAATLERVMKWPEDIVTQVELITAVYDLADDFTANAMPVVEGDRVRLAYRGKIDEDEIVATATGMLLPAVNTSREAARRTESTRNLKKIALAMHNYADTHGHFPPASGTRFYSVASGQTAESKHPHSWRVAILPFLDNSKYQDLYQQYRFDEPWDSTANQKVMANMPSAYRSPYADGLSTNTSYFVLTGPETIFDDSEGTAFDEITGPKSKTFLVVEAKREIPWTKPEDIPYAADKPFPELGGYQTSPILLEAAFADGRVGNIHEAIGEATLRMLTTKAKEVPADLP
ncbi:Regulatory protein BlaR1 [Pseudobythopirellula maris]|uniref:Regulatory protein BlaR1 n=1 Tax=Pseudobythopirellula maris TaxID=2527991 RepID=A0A5C5ZTR5_9BACT|nr:M56 family metallopeptidase [Pseudobythopirellula maris]TWT90954.1 Regulatory protein BlaR1 [Pseudobythopirellula maris]